MADEQIEREEEKPAAGAAPEPAEAAEAPEPAGSGKPQSAAEALAQQALKTAAEAVSNLAADGGKPNGRKNGKGAPESAETVEFPVLDATELNGESEGIDLLSDVNLQVKIELGRTRMFVEDVLRLREGAVVELDKLAGDPVDVYVNDRPVARGEVLILNDNFCVRINEILAVAPKVRGRGD